MAFILRNRPINAVDQVLLGFDDQLGRRGLDQAGVLQCVALDQLVQVLLQGCTGFVEFGQQGVALLFAGA